MRKSMKKIVLLTALLFSVNVYATGDHHESPQPSGTSSVSQSAASSIAVAGAIAGVGNTTAKTGDSTSGSESSTGAISYNNQVKYPNQAPPIVTTSAPSFSQRNCTPVGSVNASGPFGGLGIAFPMGGDVCNGLNESDKIGEWERESGDAKLWLVQCNLMVQKDSDLEDAFEASGYSCKDAYTLRQAKVNAQAKMRALQGRY